MKLIDGRAIAAAIGQEVAARAGALRAAGRPPTLAVVVPTRDEAAAWYVRSIRRTASKVGVDCEVHTLDGPITVEALTTRLTELSADPAIHGILCQTPLPAGMRLEDVGVGIDAAKDVDGANPLSTGRLACGLPTYPPATAAAVLEILRHEQVPLVGARAVVVGRSNVVGKPTGLLLLAQHATVTLCHSRTSDLAGVTREGDVLIAAVGRARLLGAENVKPGAVVIDVGANPTPGGSFAGDVDADGVVEVAAALTPVPGGAGPVTTMLLMRHTVQAAGG